MPTPATVAISPAISEAAALAAGLVARTLCLLERAVAQQEESPAPDFKDAVTTIATIKRAADTLKVLAPLQASTSAASASSHSSSSEPPTPASNPVDSSSLEETLSALNGLHDEIKSLGLLPARPASTPRPVPKPPQAPTTRRYGEMLSRR